MKSQAAVSFLGGATAATLVIFLLFQPVLTKQRAAVRELTVALDESSTELRRYKLQADHKLCMGDRLGYLEILRIHDFNLVRVERALAAYGL